jgi:hypothetical protein
VKGSRSVNAVDAFSCEENASSLCFSHSVAENRTLKAGSSPPRAEMPTFKWLFLKNLRSKTLGQIQNLDPHRLMSRLKSKTTPGDTLRTRLYSSPIDVWIQKIDIDGDGGRPEFGLRGHTSGPYSPAAIRCNWLWTRCRPSMATDRSSPSCSS